jgi:hypothetical protein
LEKPGRGFGGPRPGGRLAGFTTPRESNREQSATEKHVGSGLGSYRLADAAATSWITGSSDSGAGIALGNPFDGLVTNAEVTQYERGRIRTESEMYCHQTGRALINSAGPSALTFIGVIKADVDVAESVRILAEQMRIWEDTAGIHRSTKKLGIGVESNGRTLETKVEVFMMVMAKLTLEPVNDSSVKVASAESPGICVKETLPSKPTSNVEPTASAGVIVTEVEVMVIAFAWPKRPIRQSDATKLVGLSTQSSVCSATREAKQFSQGTLGFPKYIPLQR